MTSWSLTSVKTYEKCGLKYKLKYIDKIPEQRSEQASRGVSKHKVVEDFLKGTLANLPPELDFYTQFFTGLKQHENYPEHRIALKRDWTPCDWDDPEAWYKGVLDLKVVGSRKEIGNTEDGGVAEEVIVYDWKTGKIYPDHEDQKTLYSVAVFSEQPSVQRVRAIHVYLDLRQNREKVIYRPEMYNLRDQWENRVRKLEENPSLIPNPGYYCRWCGFSKMNGGPCRF